MREPRRSPAAVRWLLALALGLLGLAGAPAAGTLAGPSGGVADVAVRTGSVQYAPGRASSPRSAHAAAVVARHHAGAPAPATPGAFAAAGPDVRPALVPLVRPLPGFDAPVVTATGVPRGRAPPASTRI
ncbi:hypothetical protein [Actinomadura opuntiae]|uniref:hypothetical protein n=1 Tax=Actinomadura sp. OS1-43 TaxID=604315 RepID=UPI00255AF71E|nr:hypothetical protein [Actinomadura sp. OS1-43]MDL4818026.1 hypothetical protein [Actinomadura sp. OS1-43]